MPDILRETSVERKKHILTIRDITDDGLPFASAFRSFVEDYFQEDLDDIYISNQLLQRFWEQLGTQKDSRYVEYVLPDFPEKDLGKLEKKLFPKRIKEKVSEFREGIRQVLEVFGF